MFNPSRLTLARQRRGLTKAKLAAETKLTVRSISAFEAGEMAPSERTLTELAQALRFPVSFFQAEGLELLRSDAVSFRALSTLTASRRDSAISAGAIAIALSKWIDSKFNLPCPNIPDLRGYTPEAAADALRAAWGLGERPIKNMVHRLEANGVRVFSLVEECKQVDAFSTWRDDKAYVFLNTMKSGERSRFDAAHELGHLVLHRHGGPQGRPAETEADQFASAFLMPKASVLAAAPRMPTLAQLVRLKQTWQVSVAALAHRLFSLKLLSEWQYRTLCIEIAKSGYRTNEPEGIKRETSQVLASVFQALREEGISRTDVARELFIDIKELDSLIFGLVMTSVEGGRLLGPESERGRGHLRLV